MAVSECCFSLRGQCTTSSVRCHYVGMPAISRLYCLEQTPTRPDGPARGLRQETAKRRDRGKLLITGGVQDSLRTRRSCFVVGLAMLMTPRDDIRIAAGPYGGQLYFSNPRHHHRGHRLIPPCGNRGASNLRDVNNLRKQPCVCHSFLDENAYTRPERPERASSGLGM